MDLNRLMNLCLDVVLTSIMAEMGLATRDEALQLIRNLSAEEADKLERTLLVGSRVGAQDHDFQRRVMLEVMLEEAKPSSNVH